MSKKLEGKPELGLVYKSTLEAIAKVRRFGIEKYESSEDWRTTFKWQMQDSMLRHLFAYIEGEELDAESGLPHLAHLITTVAFEIEREYGGAHGVIIRYKSASGSLNL